MALKVTCFVFLLYTTTGTDYEDKLFIVSCLKDWPTWNSNYQPLSMIDSIKNTIAKRKVRSAKIVQLYV